MAFLLPWSAYQRFVDPPGNHLLKLHLAGAGNLNPSHDSVTGLQAVHNAYSRRPFAQILALHWANVRELAGEPPFNTFGLSQPPATDQTSLTERARVLRREYLWNALGVLNIGWLVALWRLISRQHPLKIAYATHSGWILLAVAINLFLWCMTELLLHLGLVAFLRLQPLGRPALYRQPSTAPAPVRRALRPAALRAPLPELPAPPIHPKPHRPNRR